MTTGSHCSAKLFLSQIPAIECRCHAFEDACLEVACNCTSLGFLASSRIEATWYATFCTSANGLENISIGNNAVLEGSMMPASTERQLKT